MSNDIHDIEWICECGHSSPDFSTSCNGCGQDLTAPDTPEERAEDTVGWNNERDVPEDAYPTREYSDAEIDVMLAEENARVKEIWWHRVGRMLP